MASTIALDTQITAMSMQLGINYTDEQKAFMSDFTVPTISFSSPGTGKTKAAIGGLILAETYHEIPGSSIYAVSFTRMSTGELRLRHAHDCARLGMRQTVNFSTLHSLCLSIIREHYDKLGMQSFDSGGSNSVKDLVATMEAVAQNYQIKLQPWQYRPILKACNTLNSQLVFDDEHVQDMFVFKKCKCPVEDFKVLRRCLYQYSKLVNRVATDDIMLYALEILLRFPEVSKEFKKKCRILLVDEFQDLSLLELRVISLLSDTVIAIGDMKQQIYAFQGACADIIDEYHKYFPNARIANLNKSFRCGTEIIDYSKNIIAPNAMGEQDFVAAVDRAGAVEERPNMQLSELCDEVEADFRSNNNSYSRDRLFLFRNNYSAIPIAEELFKRKLPFRVNNYTKAFEVPVISELVSIVLLATNPNDIKNLKALTYLLPELKDYADIRLSPIYKIMQKDGCSVFEINYQWRNPRQAQIVFDMLLTVQQYVNTARPTREIFNIIFPQFKEVYLAKREHYLDMPSTYYMNMVAPLVQRKPFFQFMQDENAKAQAIEESIKLGIGIRCYTFHASKGLEAQDVYMLDCNDGVCPNSRQLDTMEAAGCIMEKARDIRNERCLLFVAATRAKEKLVVAYGGEKSPLLKDYNVFESYDTLYQDARVRYEDAEAFVDFLSYQPKVKE